VAAPITKKKKKIDTARFLSFSLIYSGFSFEDLLFFLHTVSDTVREKSRSKGCLSVTSTFLVCIISINAQQPESPFPTKLDDFSIYTFKEKGITTELIECNPTSNGYAKVSIYRNYYKHS